MTDINVIKGSTLDDEMNELEQRFKTFIQGMFGRGVHFYGNYEVGSDKLESVKAAMAWHKEENFLFLDKAYFPVNCREAGDNYIALYGKSFKDMSAFWETYKFYMER